MGEETLYSLYIYIYIYVCVCVFISRSLSLSAWLKEMCHFTVCVDVGVSKNTFIDPQHYTALK